MRAFKLFAIVGLSILCCYGSASAQSRSVQFRNAMNSAADVIVTPVNGGTPFRFAIGADNLVRFNFAEMAFNIQVIPRDNQESGFRFENVNLNELAATSVDGVIALEGKFGPGKTNVVCYRRGLFGRKCVCCTQVTRGDRIEVDLTTKLRDGGSFSLVSPKMTYDEVLAPF